MTDLAGLVLAVAALAFAISIGAHYTGACVGMAYAAGALRLRTALVLMAPLVALGAFLASGPVVATVGVDLVARPVPVEVAIAIVVSAAALTAIYNFVATPTSTIQILVFAVVGASTAAGLPVVWATLGTLLALWAVAPVAAFALAYAITRVWDRRSPASPGSLRPLALGFLVVVAAIASFAMGANDVANAAGPIVLGMAAPAPVAIALGATGLAVGVLTWGRPLLERVAFRIVRLDGPLAVASQIGQSAVILVAVLFGYFTSMNQALIGAMLGAGTARGAVVAWRESVRGILIGWALGPVSGLGVGFATAWAALHWA